MWRSGCVLFLATLCIAQRQQTTGDRQIRLEDIERDNLAASQKPASPTAAPQHQQPLSSQQQQQQQQQLQQQQLAAYQQQLLLQQLQQQYFAPSPIAYGNFGGVPLMIIHGNQLGLGNPSSVPVQAYFVPTEHPYVPHVPQYIPHRYQLSPQLPVQRVALPQELAYNSLHLQQSLQPYKGQYPSASVVYPGTPIQPSQAHQQFYNAYNALYRQQQDKSSFAAGAKSTPAPPLKPQSPIYTAQPVNSAAYSGLKSYNYNQ